MNMDKLLLCRLCLTNSSNTSFVSVTPEIEMILQKYNISFEVCLILNTYVYSVSIIYYFWIHLIKFHVCSQNVHFFIFFCFVLGF